jgi:hypothetical protein
MDALLFALAVLCVSLMVAILLFCVALGVAGACIESGVWATQRRVSRADRCSRPERRCAGSEE